MQRGDHVRVKKTHPAVHAGDHGTIHSVHQGFYGVYTGGGIAYVPANHVEPQGSPGNPDPDHDNDNDIPNSGLNSDLSAWTATMNKLVEYGKEIVGF